MLELEGLTGYVQNHLVLRDDGTPWLPWPLTDAAAEIEFSSLEAMDAAFASPAADRVRADGALFHRARPRWALAAHAAGARRRARPGRGREARRALRRLPGVDATLDAVLAGAYADAVAAGRPLRHEQLVPIDHPVNATAFCGPDAVDLLWFATPEEAAAFAISEPASRAADALSGRAFGCERIIAQPAGIR